MNCPECGESIFVGRYDCICGWKATVSHEPKRYHGPPAPLQTPEWVAAKNRCLDNMRKLSFSGPGNRDWAYRLMERAAAGEVLTPQQYHLSDEAIRTDPNRRERKAA